MSRKCLFFKEIVRQQVRREVNERFERATLPDVPEERLKELLSFVVIGAGPSVELAAELYDMVYEDVSRMYPSRLLPFVSIKIIDLREKILSAYDRRIAEYATDFFQRANIECLLNKQVKVKEESVVMTDKNTGETEEVPQVAVWCSGIKLNPLCEKIMDTLPEGSQSNGRSLATDKNLRVKGSNGTIAVGDCTTIEHPRSMGDRALPLRRQLRRGGRRGGSRQGIHQGGARGRRGGVPSSRGSDQQHRRQVPTHADAPGGRCS